MVPDERHAREEIDRLLGLAGWSVQDLKAANIHASRGVAIREFPLKPAGRDRAGDRRGFGGGVGTVQIDANDRGAENGDTPRTLRPEA
jgi:hypothetical protein